MHLDLVNLQKHAEQIAREAGKIALDNLGKVDYKQKGNEGDLITKTDTEIERFISEKLRPLIDGASIFGEELGGDLDSEYVWIIDPIDGTKNFAHHMPSFFVHIALLHKSESVIGVIYDPILNRMFSASLGNGAFVDGEKVTPRLDATLNKAIVDMDFGGKEDLEWKADAFKRIAEKVYRVRITAGRYSPYLLTSGIDAFVVVNPTTQIFDQAPRVILAREAGYDVVEFDRKDWKIRIMSNPSLTQKLSEIIMNN